MHDAPYFFDPDERNMAGAISQFRLPAKITEIPECIKSEFTPKSSKPTTHNPQLTTNNCNLNPHFFAYGQFPLYLAYVSDQIIRVIPSRVILKLFQNPLKILNTNGIPSQARDDADYLSTSFPSAIFWLRFYSALSSVLTVLLVYLITKELVNSHSGKPRSNRGASRISNGSWSLPTLRRDPQDDNLWINFGLLAALLATFTPGLIQAAHFGTTESLLTFFFLASIYLSLVILRPKAEESRANVRKQVAGSFASLRMTEKWKYFILLSLVIGLALGSKLTGIFFFIPPFIALIIQTFKLLRKPKKNWFIGLLGYWVIGLFLLIVGSIFFAILSSPYNLIELNDFRSAVFGYEADVATGRFEAFYTRQFVNTTPILFQAEKIFPFALGWPIFTFGFIGFLFMCILLMANLTQAITKSIKYKVFSIKVKKTKPNMLTTCCLLLAASFLIYFLPNAYLFAKWTRFMTPIFPFFSIFAVYFLYVILGSVSDSRIDSGQDGYQMVTRQARMTDWKLGYWLIGLLIFISLLPGIAFMFIYIREDVRVTASRWIYENIPNNSYILFETANVVDIPLGIPSYNLQPTTYNLTGVSFDFYHIDENHDLYEQLLTHLTKADYFFIPSRRIFANFPKLPHKYPLLTKYYQLLFSGALGFEKVAEFSSFPTLLFPYLTYNLQPITYNLSFPDEQAEETFTVFDHPVIRIYRKVKPFTKEEYKLMFES